MNLYQDRLKDQESVQRFNVLQSRLVWPDVTLTGFVPRNCTSILAQQRSPSASVLLKVMVFRVVVS
jgi:hypothetical protein